MKLTEGDIGFIKRVIEVKGDCSILGNGEICDVCIIKGYCRSVLSILEDLEKKCKMKVDYAKKLLLVPKIKSVLED